MGCAVTSQTQSGKPVLKLIELLLHASNRQKNCVKTNLNIARMFLIHFIENGRQQKPILGSLDIYNSD